MLPGGRGASRDLSRECAQDGNSRFGTWGSNRRGGMIKAELDSLDAVEDVFGRAERRLCRVLGAKDLAGQAREIACFLAGRVVVDQARQVRIRVRRVELQREVEEIGGLVGLVAAAADHLAG